jgi:hypothetical protein
MVTHVTEPQAKSYGCPVTLLGLHRVHVQWSIRITGINLPWLLTCMAIARLKSPNHGIPTCCEDFVTLVNRSDVHGLAWDAGKLNLTALAASASS